MGWACKTEPGGAPDGENVLVLGKHRGRTQSVVTGSDPSEEEGANFSNVPERG